MADKDNAMTSSSHHSIGYNYSSGGGYSSYTTRRLRTKGELAWVLGWRGALIFSAIGGVIWALGWLACKMINYAIGGLWQGILGGCFIGIFLGVCNGLLSNKGGKKILITFISAIIIGSLGAIFGGTLGSIAGLLGTWWAWLLTSSIFGLIIGIVVGLTKGS